MCVDMETATLFTTGFYNHIPTGALLLVSDQPMIPEGVKTEKKRQYCNAAICRGACGDWYCFITNDY